MSEISIGQALIGLVIAVVLGAGSAVFIWNGLQGMGRGDRSEFEARIMKELETLKARVDALAETMKE